MSPETKTAPSKKSPEQLVKEHAKSLYEKAVSDLRMSILSREKPPVISESEYAAMLQGFATRSIKAASVFRDTWKRMKGSIFPEEDK